MTPMFPLGVPLLPGTSLPMQVFEDRYLEMIRQQLAASDTGIPEFVVVMIERGREVGGGDRRADVGTMARTEALSVADDGRYIFYAVGYERHRVIEWLDDDPFPRAMTEPWPLKGDVEHAVVAELLEQVNRLRVEQARVDGAVTPEAFELEELPSYQPAEQLFRLAAAAPIGAHDRHLVLAASSVSACSEVLERAFDEAWSVLKFRRSW